MAITRDNITYDSPYGDVNGVNDIFNKIVEYQGGIHSDSGQARQSILGNIKDAGDQFKSMFTNTVGRAPTNDELGQFFSQSGDALVNPTTREGQPLRNYTAQFIGDNFQQAANTEATNKLSDLSTQAGTLADQYMDLGKRSLSSLTDSLRNYQTSLFDKLRSQLNLSAQAGGYQDSGGQTLQEQGALKDLGNQASGILIPYAQQIQDNANAIRYGGMSAPYSLASSFAANQPNVLANTANGGLNFNNMNSMADLNFQRQLALNRANSLNLADLWTNTQPSFGSNILTTMAKTPFSGSYSGGGAGAGGSGGSGAGGDLAVAGAAA